ncbi:MAG: hypothetical protein OWP43_00005 [Sphaerochaetaceae bacterium]|nr:hypothetical protein [Sphaerochaetaceae bacterium]
MEKYINPILLILIPFLNGFGIILKKAVKDMNKSFIESTAHIPFYIWFIAVVFSTLIGFFYSPNKGSLLIFDAIVMYGIIQGSVVAFISMGIYDTVRLKR